MSPRMAAAPAAFACLLLTACGNAPQPQRRHEIKAVRAVPRTTTPVTGAVPADAQAACDSIAAAWRRIGNARVSQRDTTFTPQNVNRSDPSQDPQELATRPACVVVAYVDTLRDDSMKLDLGKRGWIALWAISTDGPDGGTLNYQRDLVRCEVRESVDGGDDSDTTYIPSPFYLQTSICWRHDRRLIVTDTLSPV